MRRIGAGERAGMGRLVGGSCHGVEETKVGKWAWQTQQALLIEHSLEKSLEAHTQAAVIQGQVYSISLVKSSFTLFSLS